MLEVENLGSDLDITVVVQDRQPVLSRQHRCQQISDSDGSVPAGASEGALRVERTLPVTVIGGQVFVRLSTVGMHLLVLRRAASAVERLRFEGGAGGHQAAGDEWLQPFRDNRQPHPGRRAGVDEEPGDHRHTSAR